MPNVLPPGPFYIWGVKNGQVDLLDTCSERLPRAKRKFAKRKNDWADRRYSLVFLAKKLASGSAGPVVCK